MAKIETAMTPAELRVSSLPTSGACWSRRPPMSWPAGGSLRCGLSSPRRPSYMMRGPLTSRLPSESPGWKAGLQMPRKR